MSGDWIKIEITTPDKPEVVAMATHLRIDQDAVVGKLIRLWGWANLNSQNGEQLPVTAAFIDRLTNCRRFATALRAAGWLHGEDGALTFAHFDRHNGSTAKARAMENRKKASQRSRDIRGTNVPMASGHFTGPKPGPEIEEEIEIQSSAAPIPAPPAPKGEIPSASPSSPKPASGFGSRPGLDALLIGALCRAEGTEVAALTASARRELEHAAREILAACPVANSYTVETTAAAYRRAFPTATLTAHALAKHWARLQPTAGPARVVAVLPAEPAGWREWIAENCPDSPFAPGGEKSALTWADLDPDHRAHLLRQLTQPAAA